MLNLGWIDFSKSDRDMVMNVLRELTEPGAVDELGIGTIRDSFSDILFPGTSTIQTRAKYFFIIPYICMELERSGKLAPREFIETLEKKELGLIDILAVGGAEGVIGKRSRQTLKRKPSSIYWSALKKFGFFTEPVSLSEYAALFYARRNASEHQKSSGKRKARYEEDTTDDTDAGMKGTSFWRVPAASDDWRENITIELTKDEAVYLREKIISMPGTSDSLLSLVLRKNRRDFIEFECFSEIDALQNIMHPELWRDYQLARDFSRFIFGAQIRYNIIFSQRKNETANKLWEKYIEEKPSVDLSQIQMRLKPHRKVMRFLEMYQAAIDDKSELDKLIIHREKDIKGPARAKLTNTELYLYDNNSINMEPLSYRLLNAQHIVRDIFKEAGNDA